MRKNAAVPAAKRMRTTISPRSHGGVTIRRTVPHPSTDAPTSGTSSDPLDAPRKLSPLKWLGGFALLILVMVVCGGLGIWMTGGHRNAPPLVAPGVVPAGLYVVLAILGVFGIVAGFALYGLVLLTTAFTFTYTRPVLPGLKVRLWFINVFVPLLAQSGAALMMAPFLLAILSRFLSPTVAGIAAFFGPFVLMQLVFAWFTPWAPVLRSAVTKRLSAMGILPDALRAGTFVGTSDPSRNSFKKLTLVEDDLGMLWFAPAMLSYRGDSSGWDIPRDDIVGIERRADAGSTSAYFGAVAVILVYRGPDGAERRVRLHGNGAWTMSGAARLQNALAERLKAWREMPPENAALLIPQGPAAFPVVPAAGKV